jgi:hypothetical protein
VQLISDRVNGGDKPQAKPGEWALLNIPYFINAVVEA